tara:strand:+ start:1296 stop:1442 length:147 start_codon:yes stop_codon:yes gene_type:complete
MNDYPEKDLNPPEYWTCEECGSHFYLGLNQEPEEDASVLCFQCGAFDG